MDENCPHCGEPFRGENLPAKDSPYRRDDDVSAQDRVRGERLYQAFHEEFAWTAIQEIPGGFEAASKKTQQTWARLEARFPHGSGRTDN